MTTSNPIPTKQETLWLPIELAPKSDDTWLVVARIADKEPNMGAVLWWYRAVFWRGRWRTSRDYSGSIEPSHFFNPERLNLGAAVAGLWGDVLLSDDDAALLAHAIVIARQVQEFIWADCYPPLRPYDAEGWRRLFQKRVDCIAEIDLTKHGGLAALRKRLLQQAALSIKALALVNRWAKANPPQVSTGSDGSDLRGAAPASPTGAERLACPMCNAPKSFEIDVNDTALGHCYAEDKSWRVTDNKCITQGCFQPRATFGDLCMDHLREAVDAQ